MDFLPLLEHAGIVREEYITLWDGDRTEQLASEMHRRALDDAKTPEFSNLLPGRTPQEALRVLENLYADAGVAGALELPIACDERLKPTIELGTQRAFAALQVQQPRLSIYSRWLEMQLPDFASGSWAEIHELRQSAAGRDFRRVLERVSVRLIEALPDLQTADDVRSVIDREYLNETSLAAANHISIPLRLLSAVSLDVGLNWLGLPSPISATLAAATEEAWSVYSKRRQWISLMNWRPSSSETLIPRS